MNFNILGVFRKIFLGYEDFVDIFGVSLKNLTIFGCHFYVFKGIFLWSRYRMGIFFLVAEI